MRLGWCWPVLIVGWLAAATAFADTRRVAVVIGNNAGSGAQPPLRYAETDAGKMARVLTELGGVRTADLFLLQGRGIAALKQTLTLARQRVAAHQADPANRVILVFYFSGHSDGAALELGRDRLTFSELRRWLSTTGAEVRLALVDSCKSGALLAAKGGTPGPAFQIRLTEDLASSGEAILTSSAADEIALESREIGGSFFTHHFISGLRGAADTSGDRLVTLTEAYQYAYAHTISTTGATVVGPQHPAYDYRLSGQGELVLTELATPNAALELPQGFQRVLVIELVRDQVVTELTADSRALVALQPGRYAVRAWRDGRVFAGRVTVAAGEKRQVRWEELAAIMTSAPRAKGAPHGARLEASDGWRDARSSGRPILQLAAGGQRGVADALGVATSVRVGVRSASPTGLSFAANVSTGTGDRFRETSALLFGGYRFGLDRGALRAWAGLELGGGAIVQSLTSGSSSATPALALAPMAGLSLRVAGPVAVTLEAHLPATLLTRDGEPAMILLPGAWLGLLVSR